MPDGQPVRGAENRASLIIVANDTGGQGKSLMSGMIATMRREFDPNLQAIATDQPDGGTSSLQRLIPRVKNLTAPTGEMAAEYRDFRFWDPILTMLVETDAQSATTLVDTGSNQADCLLAWAKASDLADLAKSFSVDLVVPFTAEPTSLARALKVINSATRPGVLPLPRIIPVANELHGSFSGYVDDKNFAAIAEAGRTRGPGLITIPRCNSELMRRLGTVTLEDLITSNYTTIANKLGMPLIKASRELKFFKNWAAACRTAFSHAGLLAPPPTALMSDKDTYYTAEESATD